MLGPGTSRYWIRMIVWLVILLIGLSACVGRFDTKPTLTSVCNVNWQPKGGMATAPVSDAHRGNGLHVLVWNIHDRILPGSMFFTGGHTEEEVTCIGDLASQYDLVLFQEAFVRPDQIARYTKHSWSNHPMFPEGGGGDWWPLRIMCEICLTPGLLMLAQDKPSFVHAEPYEAFAGWNSELNKADDFFSKGFQLVQFPGFWVLNSHMDAGRGQDSIDARAQQFQQITARLKRLVPSEASLLIAMDANLRPDREKQDRKILNNFLVANGLTLVFQNGPDLIATRRLRSEHPQSLPLKDVLSDHNALSVIIYPRAMNELSL